MLPTNFDAVALFVIGLAALVTGILLPSRAASWTTLVHPSARRLDEATRRDLIVRLGIAGTPWCEAILEEAAKQETSSSMQSLVHRALEECSLRNVSP
ncbi:MAG: hypothetical protein JOZ38_01770 [Candidatus Eremiobacteraeota bacterium]|nr:hypothetical protein [Candidatus Eremiobacteraeota bacterium]